MATNWHSKLLSLGERSLGERPRSVASKPAAAGNKPVAAVHESGAAAQATIQSWTGDDVALEIQGKNILDAYRAWMSTTSMRLPRLSDIVASDGKAALDDMMLMMKTGDDYVVVAQSTNYIRNVDRDMRGCLMSEFKVPMAEPMKELYDQAFEQKQPIYARYVSEFSKRSIHWEVLILPLAADGGGRPIFALNLVGLIDDRSAVLQMVFDRSPMGMIVAAPTQTHAGQIDDGRILIINARAKSILRLTENHRHLQTIRQLGPWFKDGTAWTRLGMTTDGGQTTVYYRDDAGKNFGMTIEAFSRFVLFSIIEVDKYEIQKLTAHW
jgi:hypothetical protein